MVHKVDIYREYGFDPEVSEINRKARKERWREDNEEYLKVKREAKRRDERITALKKIGGTKNEV